MTITVLLNDGKKFEEVPASLLDGLIAGGEIKAFLRTTGWAIVGENVMRVEKPNSGAAEPEKCYGGPERRVQTRRCCITCPEMIDGQCMSTYCPDRYKRTRYL